MCQTTVTSQTMLALSVVLLASTSGASGHDWYSELKDPAGASCCGDRDCRPVAFCSCSDGTQCLAIDGQCMPIPWSQVLPMLSPDGRPHACWSTIAEDQGSTSLAIFCVVLPGTS